MRVRLRFTKQGKVRWTSHRDVARMWERALKRAELPVAYSEGFSPRPRVSFGLALSTGHESLAEYLDVDVVGDVDVDALPPLLTPALPVGLTVTAAGVLGPGAPSLQQDVTSCSWLVTLAEVEAGEVVDAVGRLLAAPEVVVRRERKGQASDDDIRPAVLVLTTSVDDDGAVVLGADLATAGRSLRPAELVGALIDGDPDEHTARVLRTHQWIERDGARHEPLVPAAPAPLHAERACA